MTEEELIIEMYGAGSSVLSICRDVYGGDRANIGHVYYVLKKHGVYVKGKNRRFNRRYQFDEDFLRSIDTQEKAYCLGFICADGYVSESENRVVIALSSVDEDILVKIRDCFKSNSPIRKAPKKYGHEQSVLSLCSKILVGTLVSKGIRQGKSLTMGCDMVEGIPDPLMPHFLRGYFDGDGCMTLGARYSSGVKYLIQVIGTQEFLEGTFGKYFPSNNRMYRYLTCEMSCYKISSKAEVLRFLGMLYDNSSIHLDRKFDKYRAHVKPGELLESPPLREGNQQPSHTCVEGSETIERMTYPVITE